MSDQDSIFSSDKGDASSTADNNTLSDNFKDMYVGEGKKYATEADAFKGLHNAQEHLSRLEQENAQLREVAQKAKTTEELLAELRKKQNDELGKEKLDPKVVRELVKEELTASEQTKLITRNVESVEQKMKAMYGDKARDVLQQKAAELGVSIDSMMQTAGLSPNAFMAWFPQGQSNEQANLSSDVNTRNMESGDRGATGFKAGTYKYYENLRRTDKAKYMTPEIQLEMNNNAAKLGSAFYE